MLSREGSNSVQIVNDGVTIAKEIDLSNPELNVGVKLIQEVARKSGKLSCAILPGLFISLTPDTVIPPLTVDRRAGDGTTTSIVMTQAIVNQVRKISHYGV